MLLKEVHSLLQDIAIVDNQVLVVLSGSIHVEEAAQLSRIIGEYLDKGLGAFVIDLGGVDYIDSSGLGTLVSIQKRAMRQGGCVKIKNLNGLVEEVFELTQLKRVFDIL